MAGLYQRKSPFKTDLLEAQQRGSLHNNEGSSYLFSKALQTKKTMVVPPVKLKENLTEAANAVRYPLSPGLNRNKPSRMDDLACNEELVLGSKTEPNETNLLCMEVLTEPINKAPINNLENELLCDQTIMPSESPVNEIALVRKQSTKQPPQQQQMQFSPVPQQAPQQAAPADLRQLYERTRVLLQKLAEQKQRMAEQLQQQKWKVSILTQKLMMYERR